MKGLIYYVWLATLATLFLQQGYAQEKTLTLSEAVSSGLSNYQSIQAKRNYLKASQALTKNTRNEYLPNLIASAQQDFGTVNGQTGPLGAVGMLGAGGGLAAASSGPAYGSQSWNAAFGGLYLLNTNWEFFTFGRIRSKIDMANAQATQSNEDLSQEQFVYSIKLTGIYLNLLSAQRFIKIAQSNLDRSMAVQQVVRARTKSSLNPGVDSSIAGAEVSRAKLTLIEARNIELEMRNQLAQLLVISPENAILLDTTFFNAVPKTYSTSTDVTQNPQARFYQSRIDQSASTNRFLKRSILPGLNLFGVLQTRASGFDYNYTPDYPDRYSQSYLNGISPNRTNYLLGLSLSWNALSPLKIRQQANAQHFITDAYKNEYDQITTRLRDQLILSEQRLDNSLQSAKEVPFQYKAASDAYTQKSVMYKNGLANMIDLQQALYMVNKAETDMNIAYINVWQALLLKSAASGDFDLFIKQVK